VSDEREARSHPSAPEHLVDLAGLDRAFVLELFAEADRLRAVRGTPKAPRPLAGKTAALVFHKPSLRTRVSFTVGMHELGGDAVDLGVVEVSETGRESVEDVAHVLSGMVDLVVVRTFSHRLVQRLAMSATIPVINALTDHSHPCQILADMYTLWRAGRDLDQITIAWVGDGNNVLHSWLEASTLFGFKLRVGLNRTPGCTSLPKHIRKPACGACAIRTRPCVAPTWCTRTRGPAWARSRRPSGGGSRSAATRWMSA